VKKMEPLSLGVLLRSLILIHERREALLHDLEENLNTTSDRARAIERQLRNMMLIEKIDEKLTCSSNGGALIEAFGNESWAAIHEILRNSCKEYDTLLEALRNSGVGEKGLMISQIIKLSQGSKQPLNRVTAEVCCDWGCRLGKIQKNLYTSGAISRYYLISNYYTPSVKIEGAIMREYNLLRGNGIIRFLYVSIPKLRENTCELEKIPRNLFDKTLLEIWKRNIGIVELASGPLNSPSRRTPTHKMSIHVDRNKAILSPRYALEAEEGLNIGGKKYQTIVFHKRV